MFVRSPAVKGKDWKRELKLMTSAIRPDIHLVGNPIISLALNIFEDFVFLTRHVLNKNENVYATIDFSNSL